IRNPFPLEIANDPDILYHGTSTLWSSMIESEGFKIKWPIRLEDILILIRQYEKMGWNGINADGYIVLRTFSIGCDFKEAHNKLPSFTYLYRLARNYASRPGGETFTAIIIAIQNLYSYLEDNNIRKEHHNELNFIVLNNENLLKQVTVKNKSYESLKTETIEYKNKLSYLNNLSLLTKDIEKLRDLRKRILQSTKKSLPVVYALKTSLDGIDFSKIHISDIRFARPIESKEIIGKAVFPNGAKHVISSSTNEEGESMDHWHRLREKHVKVKL
ncbi:hypothetical protein ACFL2G_03135, partial [Candidatus Omnitrophota bacterium]